MNKILFILLAWLSTLTALAQTAGYDPSNPPLPNFPTTGSDTTHYYTLRVTSSPINTGVSAFSKQYTAGESIYLNANESNGMKFLYWVDGEGNTLSTSRYLTYTMPAHNEEVTAVYSYEPGNPSIPSFPEAETPTYQLNIGTKPAGAGSFNTNGRSYEAGTSVSLYAYNNSNFEFICWTNAAGDTLSTARSFYYTMPAANTQLYGNYRYVPSNPKNPGRNAYDADEGSVIIDDFTPGDVSSAIYEVTNGQTSALSKIVVAGTITTNDFSVANNYSTCAVVDFSRTYGANTVPSYCYQSNTHLNRILLPSCITRIGYYAFSEATALTELTCLATTPPTLDSNVFRGVTKGLIVFVPKESVEIYKQADGWKDYVADGTLIIMPVQNNVASLEVNLPQVCADGRYKNMPLELINVKTGQRFRYVVTDRINYTFNTLMRDTRYVALLRNQQGTELARTDTIKIEAENQSVTFDIDQMKQLRTVKASVLAGNSDITAQTTVNWLSTSGNYLAQGSELTNQVAGTSIKCAVSVPQSVAMEYSLPTDTIYQVIEDDNALNIVLAPLPQLTLTGRVIDRSTQSGVSGVTVTLSQTLNNRYTKAITAKTDSKGEYTLNGYSAPSVLTYALTDYVSRTDSLPDSLATQQVAQLPDVLLKPIQGARITTSYSYTPSVAQSVQPEVVDYYTDYQNVSYTLYNQTAQRAITQFNVQYPEIVLQEEVNEGDSIIVTAQSKNDAFMPVTTGGRISADFDLTVEVPITQLGGIRSVYTTTENPSVLAILYDAQGNLLNRYTYSTADLTISDLKDGDYTLVSMGQSDFFNSVYNLEIFDKAGLVNGTDYVANRVTVRSGIISPVKNAVVPFFDESKFYYTGANTSFTANKSSIVAGNYLTFTSKLDFKSVYADNVSGVKMQIELPEGSTFVDGSVMIGSTVSFYQLTGNTLTVPLDNSHINSRVRFCVIPTQSGTFAPNASVSFRLKGKDIVQPIGSAQYTVQDVSIRVPSRSRSREIVVSGMAQSRSEISIYDGSELIGTTKALANGYWSATCQLASAYNLTEHDICAKILTSNGMEMTTETTTCTYDEEYVEVKTVDMSFYNSGNNAITWNFVNKTTSASSYSFTGESLFTFVVTFTSPDSTGLNDVVVNVFTNNGEVVEVPCRYNEQQGKWFGSKIFNTSALPTNVSVDYNFFSSVIGSREFTQEAANFILEDFNETKQAVAGLKNELLSTEPSAAEEACDDLLKLLENKEYTSEELAVAVKKVVGDVKPAEEPQGYLEGLDSLATQFEQEYTAWYADLQTVGADSLLNAFGLNPDIITAQVPEGDMEATFGNDDKQYTISVRTLSTIDENALIEQHYTVLEMNDSTKIYILQTEHGATFIDLRNLKAYSIEIADSTTTANSIKKDDVIDNINSWTGCISTMVSWTYRLIDTATGANAEEALPQWRKTSQLLLDIKDALCCGYEKALASTLTKIARTFEWAQASVTSKIADREKEILQGQQIISYKHKQIEKLLSENLDLLDQIKLNAGNAELVAKLEQQIEKNNQHVVQFDTEIEKVASYIKTIEKEVSGLNKKRTVAQKAYNLVKKTLDKLPKKPVKGQLSKLGTATKIGGKLIGGFGVFLEMLTFYDDLDAAMDDVNDWISLLDAIIKRIPCEGNEAAAIALRDNIYTDGCHLINNYKRILIAEAVGIMADGASLAVWECPWFELGCWVTSAAVNIYAECSKHFSIKKKYGKLRAEYAYKVRKLKCGGKEADEPKEPKLPSINPVIPVVDPSGYVYEGVPSNRLQGVTATCYYKETVEDMYGDLHENVVLWDAEEYAQKNPLFTDENGMYQWDVPQGLWQVRFEKEGYQSTQSEWLPVPPPQMDVNIGMVQNSQPEVVSARAYEDGVELQFSKYMDPATLNADNIYLKCKSGDNEVLINDAQIELLNAEAVVEGSEQQYASRLRLSTDRLGYYDEARIIVSRSVQSYAGIGMTENFAQQLDVEKKVREIVVDSVVNIAYDGQLTVNVAAQPAEAAAGKKINLTSASTLIAATDATEVTLDADGHATLTINAQLPGATAIKYAMPDANLEAITLVNVVDSVLLNAVKAPRASRQSGTAVYRGQTIALSTESEGATIYYTTDGSCPCDAASRIKYERPIVINEPVTIKAMAIGLTADESDVETFNFTIRQSDVKWLISEGWNWNSHDLASPLTTANLASVATRIVTQEREAVKDPNLGLVGNLENIYATEGLKLLAPASAEKAFTGEQFNPTATPINLASGWNWLGYPLSTALSLNDALALLEPEVDDCIETLDGGFATYTEDGEWTGSLQLMQPGRGYLYKSGSDKSFVYNVVSSVANAQSLYGQHRLQLKPMAYAVDCHRYPNMMPIVATVGGGTLSEGSQIVALSDGECRGIAPIGSNGMIFLSVYGEGSETINFVAVDGLSNEALPISNTTAFTADMLGTVGSPYVLHLGNTTGIDGNVMLENALPDGIYTVSGQRLSRIAQPGLYIIKTTGIDGHSTVRKQVVR